MESPNPPHKLYCMTRSSLIFLHFYHLFNSSFFFLSGSSCFGRSVSQSVSRPFYSQCSHKDPWYHSGGSNGQVTLFVARLRWKELEIEQLPIPLFSYTSSIRLKTKAVTRHPVFAEDSAQELDMFSRLVGTKQPSRWVLGTSLVYLIPLTVTVPTAI